MQEMTNFGSSGVAPYTLREEPSHSMNRWAAQENVQAALGRILNVAMGNVPVVHVLPKKKIRSITMLNYPGNTYAPHMLHLVHGFRNTGWGSPMIKKLSPVFSGFSRWTLGIIVGKAMSFTIYPRDPVLHLFHVICWCRYCLATDTIRCVFFHVICGCPILRVPYFAGALFCGCPILWH